ncbi:MAG: hypothetical protein JWL95_2208 [Gemmatimonadetes bacterium]|nr:hypothetical protein [Gemmatimonadota bacterium]
MYVGAATIMLAVVGTSFVFMSIRATKDQSTAGPTQAGAATSMTTPLTSTSVPVAPPGRGERTDPQTSASAATRYAAPVGNMPATQSSDRGGAGVTADPIGQSYATELLALERSIKDSASARAVGKQLSEWNRKVRLASDRATLQVVEAEIASVTDDPAACKLWRRIVRDDVIDQLKNAYSESMKSCE